MPGKTDKVLLIKPPYDHVPIGLGYVMGAMKRYGLAFDFFDTSLYDYRSLEDSLRSNEYPIVATGGLIASYVFFRDLFRFIKSVNPEVACVLGGNVTSTLRTQLMFETIPLDYAVHGEGEITFPELVKAILGGANRKDLEAVKGIAFRTRDGGSMPYFATPKRPAINMHVDDWVPDYDALDKSVYGKYPPHVMTGRGCVGRCSFCAPTNGRFRDRSTTFVLSEVENLMRNHGLDYYHFINEVFFAAESDIIHFCTELKKLNPKARWTCALRADINPDVLKLMRDAGCHYINVGVESGSDRVLEAIRKDITVDQIRRFISTAKSHGIGIAASFLTANNDERPEDIAKTIDLMLELDIGGGGGGGALVINYPGTLNYGWARKNGQVGDELEFLELLDKLYSKDYHYVISKDLSGTLPYPNFSGTPKEELYPAIEREMRRYFSNFRIRDGKCSTDDASGRYHLSGHCPFCGKESSIETTVARHSIPNTTDAGCGHCCSHEVFFSSRDIPEYKAYHDTVIAALEWDEPIAVFARSQYEAMRFLQFDCSGINYERIQGFVESDTIEDRFCCNHPILPLEEFTFRGVKTIVVLTTAPLPAGLLREWRRVAPGIRLAFLGKVGNRPPVCTVEEALEHGARVHRHLVERMREVSRKTPATMWGMGAVHRALLADEPAYGALIREGRLRLVDAGGNGQLVEGVAVEAPSSLNGFAGHVFLGTFDERTTASMQANGRSLGLRPEQFVTMADILETA